MLMNSVSQWAHQHDFLLILVFILGTALAVLIRYRRRSIRLWSVWSAAAGLSVLAIFALRTPAASLSEHLIMASRDKNAPVSHLAYEEPTLQSVEDIWSLLSGGRTHTLVEIYADYGIS
jgi:hypothetical protein